MSRTEIYNMMENRNVNLSLGSNAIDFNVFNNGDGFLENLTDKVYDGKQNSTTVLLAGIVIFIICTVATSLFYA